MSEITQLVTASAAVLAVVVGPYITYRIAGHQIRASIVSGTRQIKASVVSANRQVWINNLRDSIADFLAKATIAWSLNRSEHADDKSLPRLEEIIRLGIKIELLLNPIEPDHDASLQQLTNSLIT